MPPTFPRESLIGSAWDGRGSRLPREGALPERRGESRGRSKAGGSRVYDDRICEPDRHPTLRRVKDGREWPIGSDEDIAWIRDGASSGLAITAAIPAVFTDYATLELPDDSDETPMPQHDRAVVALLNRHTAPQPWWLGYLDTGGATSSFQTCRR